MSSKQYTCMYCRFTMSEHLPMINKNETYIYIKHSGKRWLRTKLIDCSAAITCTYLWAWITYRNACPFFQLRPKSFTSPPVLENNQHSFQKCSADKSSTNKHVLYTQPLAIFKTKETTIPFTDNNSALFFIYIFFALWKPLQQLIEHLI